MNKLTSLLLKAYVGPFLLTFFIALFIFVMQFLWKHVDDLMGKGLEFSIIMELLVYASAKLVNLALPLAILLSSIMTLGALAENYELTAMKSAGNSLIRILRPLIIFIFLIAFGAFYFANNVWPVANLKFKSLLFSIVEQRPAFNLEDGVFYNGIEGFSIRAKNKDEKTNELFDVLIYDHQRKENGNRTVIHADKGTMEQTSDKRFLILTLYNGYAYDETLEQNRKRPTFPHVRSEFDRQIIRMDLSGFEFSQASEDLFSSAYDMMSLSQLNVAVDSIFYRAERTKEELGKYMQKNVYLLRDTLDFNTGIQGEEKYFYDQLTRSQKKRVISVGKEFARKTRSFIERSENDIQGKIRFANRHKVEYHRKFFFAVACIVLFFIGAPLGAIIRKGGLGLPTVFAIVMFVVYYILTISGEKMVKSGALEPWIGMWMSTFVLFPLGMFLTYKAATDSSIMDKELYVNFLKKITRFFTRKSKNENPSALS